MSPSISSQSFISRPLFPQQVRKSHFLRAFVGDYFTISRSCIYSTAFLRPYRVFAHCVQARHSSRLLGLGFAFLSGAYGRKLRDRPSCLSRGFGKAMTRHHWRMLLAPARSMTKASPGQRQCHAPCEARRAPEAWTETELLPGASCRRRSEASERGHLCSPGLVDTGMPPPPTSLPFKTMSYAHNRVVHVRGFV